MEPTTWANVVTSALTKERVSGYEDIWDLLKIDNSSDLALFQAWARSDKGSEAGQVIAGCIAVIDVPLGSGDDAEKKAVQQEMDRLGPRALNDFKHAIAKTRDEWEDWSAEGSDSDSEDD